MELGEGFKLCSGLCIGARAGKEKTQLILSFDVGAVQIYDVSDTRLLAQISWIFTPWAIPLYDDTPLWRSNLGILIL